MVLPIWLIFSGGGIWRARSIGLFVKTDKNRDNAAFRRPSLLEEIEEYILDAEQG